MVLFPIKREQHVEGEYIFYRAELLADRTLTVRRYGHKIGSAEVFNGREICGENKIINFETKDRSFDEVMTMIANYFDENVNILANTDELNYACTYYPTNASQ